MYASTVINSSTLKLARTNKAASSLGLVLPFNPCMQDEKTVENIVKDAEEKSHSIIIEAGKLLALSKENTDLMYNKLSEGLTDEANEIKVNMEKDIEDFRKKL